MALLVHVWSGLDHPGDGSKGSMLNWRQILREDFPLEHAWLNSRPSCSACPLCPECENHCPQCECSLSFKWRYTAGSGREVLLLLLSNCLALNTNHCTGPCVLLFMGLKWTGICGVLSCDLLSFWDTSHLRNFKVCLLALGYRLFCCPSAWSVRIPWLGYPQPL